MKQTIFWVDKVVNPYLQPVKVANPILNGKTIIWVKTYEEFCGLILTKGYPDYITFAWDLNSDPEILVEEEYSYYYKKRIEGLKVPEYTAVHCIKWLEECCIHNKVEPPTFHVHEALAMYRERILYAIKLAMRNINAYREKRERREVLKEGIKQVIDKHNAKTQKKEEKQVSNL